MDKKFKSPGSFHYKVMRGAPTVVVSENRRYGYKDEVTQAYGGVVIYIQKGLKKYYDLILSTVKVITNTQSGSNKPYLLVPTSFGWGDSLHNENTYFKLGYINDYLRNPKIAETIADLSGDEKCKSPAIISKLFPKTDIRSLYHGKTSVTRNDLLVIIGKKGEVFFSQYIKSKINGLRQKILFVEIDGNSINWIFNSYKPCFIEDNVTSDKGEN